MRKILGYPWFAVWIAFAVLVVVALYAGESPGKAWKLFSVSRSQGDSRPDAGFSGAGIPAPLFPRAPILVASLAKQLPRIDTDES